MWLNYHSNLSMAYSDAYKSLILMHKERNPCMTMC
jgi:hypothetical protein